MDDIHLVKRDFTARGNPARIQTSKDELLEWYTTNIQTRADDDAVYNFGLKLGQDRGLTLYHTRSFTTILSDTMPSEALVRVVKFFNSETEILFDTRSAEVTDVTRSSSSIGKKPCAAKYGSSTAKPAA